MREIRVLVVDDSAFVRKAVRRMLAGARGVSVVGEAGDGREALERLVELEPDVVTLDLRMPGMDGLETLRRIMAVRATPVVLLSSFARSESRLTMEALAAGAVDFVDKTQVSAMDVHLLAEQLEFKVRAAAHIQLGSGTGAGEARAAAGQARAVFLLGASTGGPAALTRVISRLPGDFPAPVLVVQHMPEGFTLAFAERLDHASELEVKELAAGDTLEPGRVLVVPGGDNLTLRRVGNRVEAAPEPAQGGRVALPSVDHALGQSLACYGAGTCAVILTGMGQDGLAGARAVRAAGGLVIAEAEASCAVYGMPRAVAEAGLADWVAPLELISLLMIRAATAPGPVAFGPADSPAPSPHGAH